MNRTAARLQHSVRIEAVVTSREEADLEAVTPSMPLYTDLSSHSQQRLIETMAYSGRK